MEGMDTTLGPCYCDYDSEFLTKRLTWFLAFVMTLTTIKTWTLDQERTWSLTISDTNCIKWTLHMSHNRMKQRHLQTKFCKSRIQDVWYVLLYFVLNKLNWNFHDIFRGFHKNQTFSKRKCCHCRLDLFLFMTYQNLIKNRFFEEKNMLVLTFDTLVHQFDQHLHLGLNWMIT